MQNCELWAVGRLTRDPERKFTQTGKALLSFTLATEGEGEDQGVVWLSCTLWETNFKGEPQFDFEALQGELEQGAWVYVKGRPRARAYLGKDGQPRGSLELTVTRLEIPSPTHAPEAGPGVATAADTLADIPF